MAHPFSVTAYLERVQPNGPGRQARFDLAGDRAKLGRGCQNDFILPYLSISRHHAEFQYRNGHWEIKDLSLNGILINYQPIDRECFVLLENNDIVSLVPDGAHDYRFVSGGTLRDEDPVSGSATPMSSSSSVATEPVPSTSRASIKTEPTPPASRAIISVHRNPPAGGQKRIKVEQVDDLRLRVFKVPKTDDGGSSVRSESESTIVARSPPVICLGSPALGVDSAALARRENSTQANQLRHCQERIAALEEDMQRVEAERDNLQEQLQSNEVQIREGVQGQLTQVVEDELSCVICSDVLIEPTVVECGHVFCSHCITVWITQRRDSAQNPTCPSCRTAIQDARRVRGVDGFFTRVYTLMSSEAQENREQILQQRRDEHEGWEAEQVAIRADREEERQRRAEEERIRRERLERAQARARSDVERVTAVMYERLVRRYMAREVRQEEQGDGPRPANPPQNANGNRNEDRLLNVIRAQIARDSRAPLSVRFNVVSSQASNGPAQPVAVVQVNGRQPANPPEASNNNAQNRPPTNNEIRVRPIRELVTPAAAAASQNADEPRSRTPADNDIRVRPLRELLTTAEARNNGDGVHGNGQARPATGSQSETVNRSQNARPQSNRHPWGNSQNFLFRRIMLPPPVSIPAAVIMRRDAMLSALEARRNQARGQQEGRRSGNSTTSSTAAAAAAPTATSGASASSIADRPAAPAATSSTPASSSAAMTTTTTARVSSIASATVSAPSTSANQVSEPASPSPSAAPTLPGSSSVPSTAPSTRPTAESGNRAADWQRLSSSELARQLNVVNPIVNLRRIDEPNAEPQPEAEVTSGNASTPNEAEPARASTSDTAATSMAPPLATSSGPNEVRVTVNLTARNEDIGPRGILIPSFSPLHRPLPMGSPFDHRVPSPAPSLASNGSGFSDPFARAGGIYREFSPAASPAPPEILNSDQVRGLIGEDLPAVVININAPPPAPNPPEEPSVNLEQMDVEVQAPAPVRRLRNVARRGRPLRARTAARPSARPPAPPAVPLSEEEERLRRRREAHRQHSRSRHSLSRSERHLLNRFLNYLNPEAPAQTGNGIRDTRSPDVAEVPDSTSGQEGLPQGPRNLGEELEIIYDSLRNSAEAN